jgi:hypothetical protein
VRYETAQRIGPGIRIHCYVLCANVNSWNGSQGLMCRRTGAKVYISGVDQVLVFAGSELRINDRRLVACGKE